MPTLSHTALHVEFIWTLQFTSSCKCTNVLWLLYSRKRRFTCALFPTLTLHLCTSSVYCSDTSVQRLYTRGVHKTENRFKFGLKTEPSKNCGLLFRWFPDRNCVYNPQFKLKVTKNNFSCIYWEDNHRVLASSSSQHHCHCRRQHRFIVIIKYRTSIAN